MLGRMWHELWPALVGAIGGVAMAVLFVWSASL